MDHLQKHILLIAPSSIPLNGPEAYVNAKLIKALSEAGHVIDVISRGIRRRFNYYPSGTEDSYISKIQSLNIVTVDTEYNLSTIINHLKTYLKTGVTYKGADWAYQAIVKAIELVSKNKYDYVYTFDYPSEIVGLYLAKKYNIKWVATWNDPYMLKKYPAPYGEGANAKVSMMRNKLIRQIGKYTYRNVFPSDRLKNYMLGYMTGMKPESCIISPHIIEESKLSVNTPNYSGPLKIIHSGSLGRERNPETFFKGLKMFLNENPNADIKISILGIIQGMPKEKINELINEVGLASIIEFIPPVKYEESLNLVRDYDVALIIEAACPEGIFLPSKVADYLQNGKPIFAVSPLNGTLNDLYKAEVVSYFADITSIESIAESFNIIYQDYRMAQLKEPKNFIKMFGSQAVQGLHINKILN